MKKSIIFSLILFSLLVLSINSFAAVTDYGYALSIESQSITPSSIYAGNQANIILTLKNKSRINSLENINLSLGMPEEFSPITDTISIENLQPAETTTVVFKVKANNNATEGSHVFTVFMDYDLVSSDSTKRHVTDSSTVSLNLKGVYALKIKEVKASNLRPHILDEFKITALIENYSATEAKNVLVSLSLDGSTSFSDFILVDGTERRINLIQGNSFEKAEFTLMPSKDIAVGTYTFKINTSCQDCNSSTEKIAVEVLGKPKLIISGIDYSIEGKDTKNIVQGNTFSISLQLDNIGEEKAKAVKATIDVDNGIVGLKEGFIGNIDPDDSGSAVFDLKALNNAKEGYHNTKISVEYVDELNQPQIMSKKISFYIEKKPPESPVAFLLSLLAVLVVAYFILRMVLRHLEIKKLDKLT